MMGLTPMMQQYLDIKAEHPGVLLMFRLGDFYELFFEDALTASRALEITLTGRDAGSAGRVPMCGVPHHALDQYLARLIQQGYSVAICDQTEDAKESKGLVKREVVRVVTPGTALVEEAAGNRYIAALVLRRGVFGLAFADVATGEVWCGEYSSGEAVHETLVQWMPTELLIYEADRSADAWGWFHGWKAMTNTSVTLRKEQREAETVAHAAVCRQYGVPNLVPVDLQDEMAAAEALGMIFAFVEETQKRTFGHFKPPATLLKDRRMVLDYTAIRNLELLETGRSRQRKGSLYGLLDRTKTAMGSRTLRRWLERPLQDVDAIEERLDAVSELVDNLFLRSDLQSLLNEVYDLERLIGKISYATGNARDLLAIARSLDVVPQIANVLQAASSRLLADLPSKLPDLSDLAADITALIVDEPPLSVRDGGYIKSGVDGSLDDLRQANASGKAWLAELEQREREQSGIRSLKVGYNKVFGYYIEVSKANLHLVPPHFERRQTLSTGERYIIPELKERESLILSAEERAVEREYELFCALRASVMARIPQIQETADLLAQLDVVTALATVSAENRYVRPKLVPDRVIHIEQGRHPTVEAQHLGKFVPNDARLDGSQEFMLITGPNMAGKSTFMRQTAIIVLLAHCGCFVPAQSATIGLVDRIFTRIGASDDLSAGQSTFMVEMVELAQILRQSTHRSLILLDEIGRGTSTYDGLSIAEAVMESLQTPSRRPFTLFATHYHELTESAASLPTTSNYSVLVEESKDGITFLHTVVNRPADKSYGIQVARLAGIPMAVIDRAEQLLASRESIVTSSAQVSATSSRTERRADAVSEAKPLPLFSSPAHQVIEKLAALNVIGMTPLQAIMVLNELVEQAKEVQRWEEFRS